MKACLLSEGGLPAALLKKHAKCVGNGCEKGLVLPHMGRTSSREDQGISKSQEIWYVWTLTIDQAPTSPLPHTHAYSTLNSHLGENSLLRAALEIE